MRLSQQMKTIELYATRAVPIVDELLTKAKV
jgi:hypothetical protein